ncbi:MAG: hypothetical protein FJ125_13950 [Deltaproteobacteria bacterium]|nr:hypothetical protein [Deltaproteobacteria bacterium]
MPADQTTLDTLEEAEGLLGAAWLRLGGEAPTEPHPDAVEAALAASQGYQEARREFSAAFRSLVDGGTDLGQLLDLEAAANHIASEAGWRLGSAGGKR